MDNKNFVDDVNSFGAELINEYKQNINKHNEEKYKKAVEIFFNWFNKEKANIKKNVFNRKINSYMPADVTEYFFKNQSFLEKIKKDFFHQNLKMDYKIHYDNSDDRNHRIEIKFSWLN